MSVYAGSRWGPTLLRRAAAWALVLTAISTAFGLTEASLLLRDRIPVGTALAAGVTTIALAQLLALPVSPLLAAGSLFIRRIGRFWALPIGVAAFAVSWWIPSLSLGARPIERAVLAALCGLTLAGLAWLSRTRLRGLALVAAAGLWAGALALDLIAPGAFYPDLHELAAFLVVGAAVVATQTQRKRVRRASSSRLALLVAGSTALAAAWCLSVEARALGWRAAARSHGRYTHRLTGLVRTMVDLDADGFSALGWGGDCDDLDAERHPLRNDRPGGPDTNCNGTAPPLAPTDEDRGLAPPAGDPDLPPGAIDLALLITVDCFRADAFLPEAMPRLSELARSGLVFTRSYSPATATGISTKLMQRVTNRAPPIAERLLSAGVFSTAVIGLNNRVFQPASEGFGRVVTPERLRWSAAEVAAAAIAALDAHAGAPHYLWVHFFDAHTPYREYENLIEAAAVASPPSYPEYLAELTRVDAAIGELIHHLRSQGRLARAVVVVTGDHGEGFGEHEVMRHHVSAYEAVVRVPALLIAPGLAPGRMDTLVSGRDLPPTLLGAFGRVAAEPGSERFGRSWLRVRAAPAAPLHRFVAIRSGREVSGSISLAPMLAIVDGRHKLVRTLDENLSELYDVVDAPAEDRDLTPVQPGRSVSMTRALELYRDIDQWPEWPPLFQVD